MEKIVKIIEGDVKRDVYGSFEDCSPGLYIDGDKIETIFDEYRNQYIKITVEVVEKPIPR